MSDLAVRQRTEPAPPQEGHCKWCGEELPADRRLLMSPEEEKLFEVEVNAEEMSSRELMRLGVLWKNGGHFIHRQADGSWGIAAPSLGVLRKRLQGAEPGLGVYRMHSKRLSVDGRSRPDLVLRRIPFSERDSYREDQAR